MGLENNNLADGYEILSPGEMDEEFQPVNNNGYAHVGNIADVIDVEVFNEETGFPKSDTESFILDVRCGTYANGHIVEPELVTIELDMPLLESLARTCMQAIGQDRARALCQSFGLLGGPYDQANDPVTVDTINTPEEQLTFVGLPDNVREIIVRFRDR